jgi:galactonate dehydratase
MKIARIEQFFPRHRTRLVKITTDNGLVGWGETTLEGKPFSTVAAVNEIAEYLIGRDPLQIEEHWQQIYRSAFYRSGPVLMTALSGIDQALWDIAGKHYGVPVYRLLGGPTRDRVRVYAHWGIRDLSEEGLERSRERLERLQASGYTAYKSGPPGPWRAHEPPSVIDYFIKCAYMMREWVGPDVELCFDFHGKMTPALAAEICHELRGMRPMFVEEPVPQENVGALKWVSDHVTVPIATGERLLTRWQFREVCEQHAAAYLQPDVSHVGGISELRKVANLGEIYYMHIMPHCAIGPVALAAALHVDAAVPNFLIQEQVDASLGDGLLQQSFVVKDGYIELPTRPGLGFEIDAREAEQQHHTYDEELGGEFRYPHDRSIADW